MKFLLAAIVVAPLVLLVVGTLRGRVQVRSCCAVDASKDKRMASAFRTGFTVADQALLDPSATSVEGRGVDEVRAGRAAS